MRNVFGREVDIQPPVPPFTQLVSETDLRIKSSIEVIEKYLMSTTTTSTTYVAFDDNALLLSSYPFLQSTKTKIYVSCMIFGADLGAQLVIADPAEEVLETREWTGTKRTQFFFHDITKRVFAKQQCSIKLFIKTTAALGTLARDSKIVVVLDRGWW